MPKKRHPNTGRPRIIDSPEEFDRLVDEYVEIQRENGDPLTFTGMALHLGFADRRSLYNYGERDGFYRSVKRAKGLVETQYESIIARHGDKGCGGAAFALKNHGWADKHSHELSGPGGGAIKFVVEETVVDPGDHDDDEGEG